MLLFCSPRTARVTVCFQPQTKKKRNQNKPVTKNILLSKNVYFTYFLCSNYVGCIVKEMYIHEIHNAAQYAQPIADKPFARSACLEANEKQTKIRKK